MKKRFYRKLLKAMKRISRKDSAKSCSYKTLEDGSVLRVVTIYDESGKIHRVETEHWEK